MKRSTLILLVIVLLAAAGWFGYKMVYRQVKPLTEVKTEFHLSAQELIIAFEQDTAAANKQYLGKVIEVTGNVKSVETEEKSATIVLGPSGSMSSVRCSMDSTQVQQATQVEEGTEVTIKGACTGFISEELLGSDVILNRSVLVTGNN